MNATFESYKEPIRRIADEYMDRQKPFQRIRKLGQWMEELTNLTWKFKSLILNTTLLVVMLFEVIDFVVPKIPHLSFSNAPNSVKSTPELKKAAVAVSESSTEPVKSDEVVKGSGPLEKSAAEKSGNASTSPISKNLASQPLNSSARTRKGSNSHVGGSAAVQTRPATADTHSQQLLSRFTEFPSLAKLPVPASHSSPGDAGLPMNRCAPINPTVPCIIFKASAGQSALNRTPSF